MAQYGTVPLSTSANSCSLHTRHESINRSLDNTAEGRT